MPRRGSTTSEWLGLGLLSLSLSLTLILALALALTLTLTLTRRAPEGHDAPAQLPRARARLDGARLTRATNGSYGLTQQEVWTAQLQHSRERAAGGSESTWSWMDAARLENAIPYRKYKLTCNDVYSISLT